MNKSKLIEDACSWMQAHNAAVTLIEAVLFCFYCRTDSDRSILKSLEVCVWSFQTSNAFVFVSFSHQTKKKCIDIGRH